MKRLQLLICLLVLPLIIHAQSYTYIGANDGLSHRHVYSIKKDTLGYLWFLTYEGVDRFNGSEFKHYNFSVNGEQLNSSVHLKNLFYTPDHILWQIGTDGKVFQYNPLSDQFDFVYKYPNDNTEITLLDFSYIDSQQKIWMSHKGNLHIYDYKQKKNININQHPLYATTTAEEIGGGIYAIGTTHGVFGAKIANDSLQLDSSTFLIDKLPMRIEQLYYHKPTNTLIIASLRQGIFIYDLTKHQLSSRYDLQTTSVNRIITYSDSEVLVATNGAGVYLLNVADNNIKPYIQADYDSPNAMNGNSIKDILLDNNNRIWMATYPAGVTIRNDKNMNYEWVKHTPRYNQSLVHNEVNNIIQDRDGDIWFATANGVSLYRQKEKKWEAYLSSYNKELPINNRIFLSLAEIKPGIVWVGGYNSGVYEINKVTRKSRLLLSNELQQINLPDKCIRSILIDKENNIWMGGYYNLKLYNLETDRLRYFSNLNSITSLIERDDNSMWVGSAKGLFILDKKSGNSRQIELPIKTSYIHTLYQHKNKILYIGTNEGLLIFNPESGSFECVDKDNSSFLTNSIRSIVADSNSNYLFVGTDKGLSKIDMDSHYVTNWTEDQGLLTTFFNGNAGIQLSDGTLAFGSADGVVAFNAQNTIYTDTTSKLIFEELQVNQKAIHANDESNILNNVLNQTNKITLKANQDNILLKISSINYDSPSNIMYQWKLEGVSEEWSIPTTDNKIIFTSLRPGDYRLLVRAVTKNDENKILEERAMAIEVLNPFWWTIIARVIYLIFAIGIFTFIVRYLIQRSERKLVDNTKRFYYNTAHDIRVPLRLIKEPLMELSEKEDLSSKGEDSIRVILRNLNTLLAQNDNAINYERMEKNKDKLYLSEHNIIHFIENIIKQIHSIAELKQIDIKLESSLKNERAWIDKDKVQTILNNLLNIAIDRSPDFSTIRITVDILDNQWNVSIHHKGDSFSQEQIDSFQKGQCLDEAIYHNKNIQKELGLRLVCQLVTVHKGTVVLDSDVKAGTTFTISFPMYIQVNEKEGSKLYLDDIKTPNSTSQIRRNTSPSFEHTSLSAITQQKLNGSNPTLLLVEDNTLLQDEIKANLGDKYSIHVVDTAKEALRATKQLNPDLVIAKMILKDMKGTDLSLRLKADLDTSHIPIILMTDKNDEKHILKGLQNGADEFILKPFNYRILKASIANLLTNRALLRDKYANLDIQEPIDCINCSTNLDREFISSVKRNVEDHMSEPDFTVDSLCSLLNMSRTSFYNKLKALTNQTPSDYIRFIKLNHAAELLKTKEYTIAEIADRTGFNDAKYFREVFKKHYNMTPSKYAKENSL